MKKLVRIHKQLISKVLPVAVLSAVAIGCGADREIKTYKVAKEDNHSHLAQEHASEAKVPGMQQSAPMPHLHGDTPEGWQELAGGRMRAASFRVMGDGGKTAEVA